MINMQKSVNNNLKTNKKAQDLSIGTLILIVLGIIVLVLLILGFSYGWSSLWEKINIFGGGGSSIADVVINCNLAVTSNAVYTYCNDFKKVKVNNEVEYVNCEDDRVASGLTTKLQGDCEKVKLSDNTEVSPAQKKCLDLIGTKTDKNDILNICTNTKVNNKPCRELDIRSCNA